MFETTWDIAGKHIYINSDYMGDAPASWDEENWNRNEILLEIDDVEETFDIWGSVMQPQFDEDDTVRSAIATLASDALDYIQDQIDEVTSGMNYSRAKEIAESCEELANKFENLGLGEDELIEIANWNR